MKINKTRFVGARFTESKYKMLDMLCSKNGMNRSEMLAKLVEDEYNKDWWDEPGGAFFDEDNEE